MRALLLASTLLLASWSPTGGALASTQAVRLSAGDGAGAAPSPDGAAADGPSSGSAAAAPDAATADGSSSGSAAAAPDGATADGSSSGSAEAAPDGASAGKAPSAAPAPSAPKARAFSKELPRHVVDGSTGTRFESSMRVGGIGYRCLGAGVRRVLFFRAYAVTFCMDERRLDDVVGAYLDQNHPGLRDRALRDALRRDAGFFDHLANAQADKLVVMQLVRDISKDRIASAFRDSLQEVLPSESVEKLIETIPGDGKDGQKILLHARGSRLVIDIAGDAKRLDDPLITRNLWRVWLGPDSVTPSLKEAIADTVAEAR